ncbi:Aldo/keto reductase [Ramaria rubella]|nr:Aldo/keto reductase [Ramaria rubella]
MTIPTKLLSNGVQIPWIGFGIGTALKGRDVEASVTLAVESGFRHVDGAQGYRNEDSLGRAIAKFPRDSLFVTTKLTKLNPGESVRESLLKSLKRLGVQYVDLWLIHTPAHHVGMLKEVWMACEEVYREGLVRSIGVSNFTIKHLQEILEVATVKPHVNQIEFHPYVLQASKPLLEFHKQHGIVTESYGGLAPITSNAGGPVVSVLMMVQEAVEKRSGSPVTQAQILIKWLEAKGVAVVTTSSKESRLKEYLNSEYVPILTPEEIEAIDTAGAKTRFRRFASYMDT